MNVLEITHKHGQEMYLIGLEYAINMIEIAGTDILPQLKCKLETERKELENE